MATACRFSGATPRVSSCATPDAPPAPLPERNLMTRSTETHMQSTGNPHVDRAIEEIDAAIFSGDALDDINAALALQKWMHRWERGLLKKFTPEGQEANYDPSAY